MNDESSFHCLAQTALFLEDTQGVVLADAFYSHLLNVLNQRHYLAGPPGFSNVFLDAGARTNLARYFFYTLNEETAHHLLSQFDVSYIVLDPWNHNKWPLGIRKLEIPQFEKVFECNERALPILGGDRIDGPFAVYKVKTESLHGRGAGFNSYDICYQDIPYYSSIMLEPTGLQNVMSDASDRGAYVVYGRGNEFDLTQARRIADRLNGSVLMDDIWYKGNKEEELTFLIGGPFSNKWIGKFKESESELLYRSPSEKSCILKIDDEIIVGGSNEKGTIDAVNRIISYSEKREN